MFICLLWFFLVSSIKLVNSNRKSALDQTKEKWMTIIIKLKDFHIQGFVRNLALFVLAKFRVNLYLYIKAKAKMFLDIEYEDVECFLSKLFLNENISMGTLNDGVLVFLCFISIG